MVVILRLLGLLPIGIGIIYLVYVFRGLGTYSPDPVAAWVFAGSLMGSGLLLLALAHGLALLERVADASEKSFQLLRHAEAHRDKGG